MRYSNFAAAEAPGAREAAEPGGGGAGDARHLECGGEDGQVERAAIVVGRWARGDAFAVADERSRAGRCARAMVSADEEAVSERPAAVARTWLQVRVDLVSLLGGRFAAIAAPLSSSWAGAHVRGAGGCDQRGFRAAGSIASA